MRSLYFIAVLLLTAACGTSLDPTAITGKRNDVVIPPHVAEDQPAIVQTPSGAFVRQAVVVPAGSTPTEAPTVTYKGLSN